MSQCKQVSTALHSLSALLKHPDFQEGFSTGQLFFFDSYEEAPLTEEEMIEAVETNLSRASTERERKISRLLYGEEPPSYLVSLGYVIGVISKGLTSASHNTPKGEE